MKVFSAPTAVSLGITDVCNTKCRHCYNFWRHDNAACSSLTIEQTDHLIDMCLEAGVFHVILNGGEPFCRFEVLEYALKRLIKNGISISCNSNLMLATEDKLKRLLDAGLDHILTSLSSSDAEVNDYMVNQPGALHNIIHGIELAVSTGIRVSVNMVIGRPNLKHVFQTGELVNSLGCERFFGTRVVPCVTIREVHGTEFELTIEDARYVLDELLRVKEDKGIMVGTLVNYPLCLLGDLDRYRDFVGRGCPTQAGHMMTINATGDFSACCREEQNYGNVFEIGLIDAWKKLHAWHREEYRNPECQNCDYIDICHSGCRMSAKGYYGQMNAPDPLMCGQNSITRPYEFVANTAIYEEVDKGMRFTVPKRIRWRKEDGFYLLNIRWGNTITVDTFIAEFLIQYQSLGTEFDLDVFGHDRREQLVQLFLKDAIEPVGTMDNMVYDTLRSNVGVSLNPSVLQ